MAFVIKPTLVNKCLLADFIFISSLLRLQICIRRIIGDVTGRPECEMDNNAIDNFRTCQCPRDLF